MMLLMCLLSNENSCISCALCESDSILSIGPKQYYKAKKERESWEMGCPSTQGKIRFYFVLFSFRLFDIFCCEFAALCWMVLLPFSNFGRQTHIWEWPDVVFLFQVRPVAEDEMFKVLRTGKRKSKYSMI